MSSRERPAPRALRVAKRFGERAGSYDEHARLQRQCAARLAGFIAQAGGLPPGGFVVEIGCGTGLLTELLADGARPYLATDLAPEMLQHCRERLGGRLRLGFQILDGQRAVFPEPPAAIVSNLTAQWFDDPVAGLVHLARQTRFLAFSVPVAGSFAQWEAAFGELGRSSGLLSLPRAIDLMNALADLSPARLVHSIEEHTLRFDSVRAFVDSFRRIGADQPRSGYRPRPIRPVLRRFAAGMDVSARVLYGLVEREAA